MAALLTLINLLLIFASAALATAVVFRFVLRRVKYDYNSQTKRSDNEYLVMGAPFRPSRIAWVGYLGAIISFGVFILGLRDIILGSTLTILLILLPHVYQHVILTRYNVKVERGLVDCVEMWVHCLHAGMSFQQAIAVSARDLKGPVALEMQRILNDIAVSDLDTALWRWQERLGTQDVRFIVLGVLTCRQSGGKISEVVSNVADAIRSRIELREKVQSLTSMVRTEATLMAIMPLALALGFFFIDPDMLATLGRHTVGIVGTIFAAVWEMIGLIILHKMAAES